MTLIEFVTPVVKGKNQPLVLAVLYYKQHYEGLVALTVDEIRKALRGARVKNWAAMNISDVLARGGHFVHAVTEGAGGRRAWKLTGSGEKHVRETLGLGPAEVVHDVGSLTQVIGRLADIEVKDYVSEALVCLQAGALRACVVFLWSGAIRVLQGMLLARGEANLNGAVHRHDPKARAIGKVEDFSYIKDRVTLLAAADLGVVDKHQKDTLQEALDLRNRCGHPGNYKPGIKKVSGYVEDLVSVVFS